MDRRDREHNEGCAPLTLEPWSERSLEARRQGSLPDSEGAVCPAVVSSVVPSHSTLSNDLLASRLQMKADKLLFSGREGLRAQGKQLTVLEQQAGFQPSGWSVILGRSSFPKMKNETLFLMN